jgi:hypothetical protein
MSALSRQYEGRFRIAQEDKKTGKARIKNSNTMNLKELTQSNTNESNISILYQNVNPHEQDVSMRITLWNLTSRRKRFLMENGKTSPPFPDTTNPVSIPSRNPDRFILWSSSDRAKTEITKG